MNVCIQSTMFNNNNIIVFHLSEKTVRHKEGIIKAWPFQNFIYAHSANKRSAIPTFTPPHIRTWPSLYLSPMSLAFHSMSVGLKQEDVSFQ